MANSLSIRLFADSDWTAVWRILEPVFRSGETYVIDRDISEEQARDFWITDPDAVYVATNNEFGLCGTYFLRRNAGGPGSHVCNCGYVVAHTARGHGIARQMCLHSLRVGRELGYTAMQFNAVVSTNTVAVKLWQQLGFDIVGTIPGGFNHPTRGYVDLFVMHKSLDGPDIG